VTGAIAVDRSHIVAAFAPARRPVCRVPCGRGPAVTPTGRDARNAFRRNYRRAQCWARCCGRHGSCQHFLNAVDARIALRALSRGRRLLPGLGYPDLGQFLFDVA
jgi:hypothetical protein